MRARGRADRHHEHRAALGAADARRRRAGACPGGAGAVGRRRLAVAAAGARREGGARACRRRRWDDRHVSSGPGWAERGVERTIREAQERGDFDDLPGAGKPLRLGSPHDEDWWVRQLIERENLSLVDALPPALALRREAEQLPGSLARLATERQVREHLDDFNARVEADWRRPAVGPTSPVVALPGRRRAGGRAVARPRGVDAPGAAAGAGAPLVRAAVVAPAPTRRRGRLRPPSGRRRRDRGGHQRARVHHPGRVELGADGAAADAHRQNRSRPRGRAGGRSRPRGGG